MARDRLKAQADLADAVEKFLGEAEEYLHQGMHLQEALKTVRTAQDNLRDAEDAEERQRVKKPKKAKPEAADEATEAVEQ